MLYYFLACDITKAGSFNVASVLLESDIASPSQRVIDNQLSGFVNTVNSQRQLERSITGRMSTRRLQSGAERAAVSSPMAQRPRQSNAPSASRAPRSAHFPPYEPPSCPLPTDAQRKINDIRNKHDYGVYKKQIEEAFKYLTDATATLNERLAERKSEIEKVDKKRPREEDKTKEDLDKKKFTMRWEKEVEVATVEAESQMRKLIDYGEEVTMLEKRILQDVVQTIAENAAAAAANGEDEEGAEVLSAVELLKQGKEAHKARWEAMSMQRRQELRLCHLRLIANRETIRYAENNEYSGFKRALHDARTHAQENPPPVPKASDWFKDGAPVAPVAIDRRAISSTDNTNNGDEDDSGEEIVMTSAKSSLKCPLTLQIFREPYTNKICNHTFEKSSIIEYIEENGTSFQSGRRQANGDHAPLIIKCPSMGCENVLLPLHLRRSFHSATASLPILSLLSFVRVFPTFSSRWEY